MKAELRRELEIHFLHKVSTALILVILFLASVQVMSHGINSNSDTIKQNSQVIADLQTAQAFQDYYERTNQTGQAQRVTDISENLLQNATQEMKDSQLVYAARVTGSALSVIDPFYPSPCTVTSRAGCRLYLNSETVNEINQTLENAGTGPALRDFAEEYSLNASEEFYENYAKNSTENEGSGVSGLEQNLSKKELDAWTYIVNILYLAFVGFLITSAASIIYRTMNGDET